MLISYWKNQLESGKYLFEIKNKQFDNYPFNESKIKSKQKKWSALNNIIPISLILFISLVNYILEEKYLMKKKISILTILILILSILIYFILSKNNFFKSEDINQNKDLTKIILSNKSICEKCPKGLKEVQLEKRQKWYVNNKYKANENQINILLETIKKMTIQRPVGVNERSNILKRLDTQRTKVELIKNSDTIKTILVGGNTADQLGTYMIIKDSLNNEPYVFHIDGFNGYLNSRFSCEESNWIDKTIFNLSKKEISKIELNYLDDNNKSFWIEKSNFQKLF